MKRVLMLLPFLLAFSTGTILYEDTQLYRDRIPPFVGVVSIPALPTAQTVTLEIEGAAYTQLDLMAFGYSSFDIADGSVVQGAALGNDIVLELPEVRPGIQIGTVPPGTQITLIWLHDFNDTVDVPVGGLPNGETVQWIGNTSGWSGTGGGSWGLRAYARHTLRGTVTVCD